MIHLDALSTEEMAAVAEVSPQELFEPGVGFFESFRIWECSFGDVLMSPRLSSVARWRGHVLHHLRDIESRKPWGHAVSMVSWGDSAAMLLEVHPKSFQSLETEFWLEAHRDDSGRATVLWLSDLGVYLLAVGAEGGPPDQPGLDKEELLVVEEPHEVTVVHSLADSAIRCGTSFESVDDFVQFVLEDDDLMTLVRDVARAERTGRQGDPEAGEVLEVESEEASRATRPMVLPDGEDFSGEGG